MLVPAVVAVLQLAMPVSPPVSELQVLAGVSGSVDLLQSTAGRRFVVQEVSWGRDLTPPAGPSLVRGRFAWAIEVAPAVVQTRPSRVWGAGVAPIVWRWRFVPRRRWSAWAELAAGGLWSSSPIPEGSTRANFTAHWGAGARLRLSDTHGLVVAYRFHHLSNGNQLNSNPGVNAHMVLAGWSRLQSP